MFEASTTVHLGNDWSALFWCDRWLDGSSIQSMAPNLCNTVRVGTRARRLVYDALQNERWIRDIKGALDMAALEQYVMLCAPCRRFTSTIAWRIILSGSGLPINAIFQDRRIGPSSMISAA
jgi:hypothetical protein